MAARRNSLISCQSVDVTATSRVTMVIAAAARAGAQININRRRDYIGESGSRQLISARQHLT